MVAIPFYLGAYVFGKIGNIISELGNERKDNKI